MIVLKKKSTRTNDYIMRKPIVSFKLVFHSLSMISMTTLLLLTLLQQVENFAMARLNANGARSHHFSSHYFRNQRTTGINSRNNRHNPPPLVRPLYTTTSIPPLEHPPLEYDSSGNIIIPTTELDVYKRHETSTDQTEQ